MKSDIRNPKIGAVYKVYKRHIRAGFDFQNCDLLLFRIRRKDAWTDYYFICLGNLQKICITSSMARYVLSETPLKMITSQ